MRALLALVLLILIAPLYAQTQEPAVSARLFLRWEKAPQTAVTRDADFVWVHAPSLHSVVQLPIASFKLQDFPIGGGESGTLQLQRRPSAVDGRTQWMVGRRAGRDGKPEQAQLVTGPQQYVWEGSIADEPSSRVWMSIVGGQIYATIHRSDGRTILWTPAERHENDSYEHLVIDSRALSQPAWQCYAELLPDYEKGLGQLQLPKHTQLQSTNLLEASVAVETTTSLYQRLGRNLNRLYAYIASVFAMASRIYEDEMNVRLVVTWVLVWTQPPDGEEDPYQNDSDISALLSEVGNYWNAYRSGVPRDVAHVMTSPSSTDVGGIARLNTLCDPTQAYSVSGIRGTFSYPTVEYTWDVMVVAHEIGHVFGAPHTHACFWNPPLDTCVTRDGSPPIGDACYARPITQKASSGSIMSYCHLIVPAVNMTFLPKVATLIRTRRAERCLQDASEPVVLIQHPVGNQTFDARNTVSVRWTSALVQAVNLEYSTDNMNSWIRIETSLPASQRTYQWQPPRENLTTVWLRVYDATNPAVGDTTYASFTLRTPTITLTSPVGGERIGQGERYTVQWNTMLVGETELKFSSNNGAQWTSLQTGTSTRYTWQVPNIVTDQALIRVEATDGSTAAQSAPFSIGEPVMRLLVPNGGERWIGGTQNRIQWQTDFVSRIKIEYSTNGGESWSVVRLTQDAATGEALWTVPNAPTDRALVRIINLARTDQIVQSANTFTILPAGTVSVEDQAIQQPQFSLFPQPLSGEWVFFQSDLREPVTDVSISMIDAVGRERGVLLRADHLPSGKNVLALPIPADVVSGTYFIRVLTSAGAVHLPLIITR